MGDESLRQEGRTSQLEVKMDRVLPMIEDLHCEMIARGARRVFIREAIRYFSWIGAGVVSLLGAMRLPAFAEWLKAFPH